MKKQNETTTTKAASLNITATATPEELYTAAEIAVSISLRALHNKSGLKLYQDLQTAYYNDRKARRAEAIAADLATLQDDHDSHQAAAEVFQSIADRMTVDEDTRQAAAELAADERQAMHRATDEADSLRKGLEGVTLSDRADLVQAALVRIVETWTDPAELPKDIDPDSLTPEELEEAQQAANFRAAINAAGQASRNLSHPDSMNRNSTTKKAATAEDVAEWERTMGATGKDIKRPASRKNTKAHECYDTMEFKTYKATEANIAKGLVTGWYLIRHYKTTAPYVSYEAFTEASGGDTAELVTNGGINLIESQEAAEAIEALLKAANLSARQNLIVRYYLDNTAQRAGAKARLAYWSKRFEAIDKLTDTDSRRRATAKARKTAEAEEDAARWNNALERAGVQTDGAKRRQKSEIISRLKAIETATEAPTEAEQAAREFKHWEAMQGNRSIMRAAKPESRPDLIKAVETAAASIEAAAAVAWIDPKANRIEWATTEATRAAEAAAWRAKDTQSGRIIYEAAKAHQSRTAYTALDAGKAAMVFLAHMTPEELAEANTAHMAAEAARKAAEKAHHDRVMSLNTTFETWRAWTPEQRAAHRAYLDSLSKTTF